MQHDTVQYLYVYASEKGGKARHEAGHTLTTQLMEVARLGALLAAMERGRTCHLQDLSVRCASSACVRLSKVTACAKHPATLSVSLQRSGAWFHLHVAHPMATLQPMCLASSDRASPFLRVWAASQPCDICRSLLLEHMLGLSPDGDRDLQVRYALDWRNRFSNCH